MILPSNTFSKTLYFLMILITFIINTVKVINFTLPSSVVFLSIEYFILLVIV